jgi:hypothetical protein
MRRICITYLVKLEQVLIGLVPWKVAAAIESGSPTDRAPRTLLGCGSSHNLEFLDYVSAIAENIRESSLRKLLSFYLHVVMFGQLYYRSESID